MKKLIITIAASLIAYASFAGTGHKDNKEGTRVVSRSTPKSLNDGQAELVADDSISISNHGEAHHFVRPMTDYQVIIIANTMQLKVYDGARYVGTCAIDQLRQLIIRDGVNDNLVHPLNAIVNNK